MENKQYHHERINPYLASLFQIKTVAIGFGLILFGISSQFYNGYTIEDLFELIKHTIPELCTHLGSVAVAMGFLELAHRRLIDREFAEDIDDISNLFHAYKDLNVTNIIDEMSPPFFKNKLRYSRKVMLIITYLPGMELYLADFKDSAAFKENRYQIYLLHKDNPQVTLRHNSLASLDGVKDKIEASERFLTSHGISFKSYDSIIAFPIFVFDETAYIGFYRCGKEAIGMPWIEIDMSGKFGQHIKEHIVILDGIVEETEGLVVKETEGLVVEETEDLGEKNHEYNN